MRRDKRAYFGNPIDLGEVTNNRFSAIFVDMTFYQRGKYTY
jgi:hypothetical protein